MPRVARDIIVMEDSLEDSELESLCDAMDEASQRHESRSPWLSLSELAMVRSYFYPDRSPLDPPLKHWSPYHDASGNLVNTYIPPSFDDNARRAISRPGQSTVSPQETIATGDTGFSYGAKSRNGGIPGPGSRADTFFPEQPEKSRQEAIDQVQAYVLHGKSRPIPHGMLATTYLTSAIMHDERMTRMHARSWDYVMQHSVESSYANAINKFVTGYVDRDIKLNRSDIMTKSRSSSKKRKAEDAKNTNTRHEPETNNTNVSNSMLSNAAQVGLPASFVELRHEIIHEDMPPVPTLKLMAFRALDWLWENFWLKLDVGDDAWGLEERMRRKMEYEALMRLHRKNEEMQSLKTQANTLGESLVGIEHGNPSTSQAMDEM